MRAWRDFFGYLYGDSPNFRAPAFGGPTHRAQ